MDIRASRLLETSEYLEIGLAEVVTIVANFRFRHQILNFLKKLAKYIALLLLFFVSYFMGTPLIKFL
jgi:exonuclease V gamma subunit